jgi:hypothetical protein
MNLDLCVRFSERDSKEGKERPAGHADGKVSE